MSEPFEILEHTADIGFRAWGATAEELFANAAKAMMSIATDTETVRAAGEISVEVAGTDYADLLVNWLSEVLYLFDSCRFTPKEFRIEAMEPTRLRATLRGEPRDEARHAWKLIIKAVTYHELEVAERNGRWEARVYLDI